MSPEQFSAPSATHRRYVAVHQRTGQWTPVEPRVEFKLVSLCQKTCDHVMRVNRLSYLTSMLTPHRPTRPLPSSASGQLAEPPHNINFAARRLPCAAPRTWNHAVSRSKFDQLNPSHALKTFLYFSQRQYYLVHRSATRINGA
jgi:hypothetical protein